MLIISLLLSFVVIFLIHLKHRYIPNGPPGPISLPIIGNLHQVSNVKPQEQLDVLYKRYGRVFSLWMGSIYTIVLNEPEIIQTAFTTQSSVFSGRYLTPSLLLVGDQKDLSFSNDYMWKKLRSIYGNAMSKSKLLKLEDIFLNQIEKLSNLLMKESKTGDPIAIKSYIRKISFNFILKFMFSSEISYNKSEMSKEEDDIMYNSEKLVKLMAQGNPCDFIPWTTPFCNFTEMEKVVGGILHYSRIKLEEHKKHYNKNNLKDFIDLFLNEIEIEGNQFMDDDCIVRNCLDLFVAGTDTSTITMQWFIILMTNRPDVQEMIYKELKENSNPDTPIDFSMRSRFPILQSAIKEGLRLKPTSPLGLPHVVTEDTTLDGYFIPKGSQVISNAYSASLSDKIWKNAKEFDPTRFLNDEKPSITFGTGVRRCVGINFAELSIFLIISNLFRTFKFKKTTKDNISEEPQPGLVLETPSFKVYLEPR